MAGKVWWMSKTALRWAKIPYIFRPFDLVGWSDDVLSNHNSLLVQRYGSGPFIVKEVLEFWPGKCLCALVTGSFPYHLDFCRGSLLGSEPELTLIVPHGRICILGSSCRFWGDNST